MRKNADIPIVSVIMSVYNGERFLCEAIDSILNQSFSNFEFIIINDGSTDKSGDILESYDDARIRVIHQEKQHLTKSLNMGLRIARGKYIARMDADDIAMPTRLEEQVSFLDSHSDIAVVGCWAFLIDGTGKILKQLTFPCNDREIRRALIYTNPIIHPGVVIRKEALIKVNLYREEFKYAQDRDLWFRIMEHYKLANLPRFLMKLRFTGSNISILKRKEQKKYVLKSIIDAINRGLYPKWCYIYAIRYLLSIYSPSIIKDIKNKIVESK